MLFVDQVDSIDFGLRVTLRESLACDEEFRIENFNDLSANRQRQYENIQETKGNPFKTTFTVYKPILRHFPP